MQNFPEIIFPIPREDSSALFEFYNKNFPDSQWTQKHWDTILSSRGKSILIGLKNKASYVGLVFGEIIGGKDSSASVNAIVIDRRFRRNGYGSFLIRKFLKIAFLEFLVNTISLHFRDSNESSLIEFYTNLGFNKHHEKGFYSNGESKHCLSMTKDDFLATLKAQP